MFILSIELLDTSQDLYIELYHNHDVFYTSTVQQQQQQEEENDNENKSITWNLENIELFISANELKDKSVKLRIKEKNLITSDEVIGKVILNCDLIIQGNGEVVEIHDKILTKKDQENGEYSIKARYFYDS